MEFKNKKTIRFAAAAGLTAVLAASIHLSYATTVGISDIEQNQAADDMNEMNTGTDDMTGTDAQTDENGVSMEDENDNLTYNPDDPYENTDEMTEKSIENKELLASLTDSWEENPGGSSYTDEGAYYKVGNLTDQPGVDAPSAILMDASSGFVLYNKNATEKKYPASMTKVMTALVALKNGSLDDIISFSDNAVNNIPSDATKAGFSAGDKASLKDVLCGLFMSSGADAAVAIAEHYGGTEKDFAAMMNTEAQQLGCANTHFVNSHGMHDAEHYTTAYDMALIMQEAISIQELKDVLGMKSCTVKNENGNSVKKEIHLENKSAFITNGNKNYFEPAKGSKTGHTNAAKYTLVSYAEKENETLIAVVLDEENFDKCYADHKKLYEWGYAKTQILMPMPGQQDIEGVLKSSLSDDKFEKIKLLSLKYISGYKILTNRAVSRDNMKSFFVLDEDMENGILGYLNVSYYDKILIGRTPILYNTEDSGYESYIDVYKEIVAPEPIVITPDGDGSNSEGENTDDEPNVGIPPVEEPDIWADDTDSQDEDKTEESTGLSMDESIFQHIAKGYVIYGAAMAVLCVFTYIILLIRRRKGY